MEMDLIALVPLAVLGAILGLDVVSFPQAMISRPLVAATAAGALIGEPTRGLAMGEAHRAVSVPPRRLTVAIDGPAGAGKSTAARMLARRLDYALLDTALIHLRRCAARQETATRILDRGAG